MTGLHDLFDDLAGAPAPPRPLDADELFTVGQAHRRRRSATLGAAAATTLVAALAAGTVMLTSAGSPADRSPSDRPAAGPSTAVEPTARAGVPHPGEHVQRIGVADRRHLYLTFFACVPPGCNRPNYKTHLQLVGSDDGGRTWADRGSPIDSVALAVLGPRTLISVPPDQPRRPVVSIDGGRGWSTVVDSPAVASVPADGTMICWTDDQELPCRLHALQPVSRRLAPLATQPALTMRHELSEDSSLVGVDGRWWVAGTDPSSGRPAVAVSTDAGRTWSTHVFDERPECTSGTCAEPILATADGRTVYAVRSDQTRRMRVLHRGTVDGGWAPQPVGALPYHDPDNGDVHGLHVTDDGVAVLAEVSDAADGSEVGTTTFWTVTSAGPSTLDATGLPRTADRIRRAPDGWYYTQDYTDGSLYGSDDGRRFTPVAPR